MATNLTIQIVNQLAKVDMATKAFRDFSAKYRIPAPIVTKFIIAFDELLTNIINYGLPANEMRWIDIRINLDLGVLTVTISDDGTPFDPFSRNAPNIDLALEDRPIGGLGIHIVRNFMEDFSYHYENGRNIVTLKKKIEY